MNNKAFTLIELIGVIVLLSLLVLIFVPTVDKVIKQSNEKIDKQNKENIIMAARNWASDNIDKIPTTITLERLQLEGYVDKNIKNTKTNKIVKDICIEITKDGKLIDYKYISNCKEDINE